MRTQRLVLSILLGALSGSVASAGGFEFPEHGARAMGRGGAWTVGVDDLTALALNPAGLLRLDGTHLYLSDNLMWHDFAFTRAPSGMDLTTQLTEFGGNAAKNVAPTYPGDPLETIRPKNKLFPLGAMLGLGSDFGLKNWHFALGVYGPNAFGKVELPQLGGQRYMLTSMDMLLLYYSLSFAYGEKEKWAIGATFQIADMPKSEFGLVVHGIPSGGVVPYYSTFDLLSTLDLKFHSAFSMIWGGWWRPIPQFEIGASARLVPVFMKPKGKVKLASVEGITLVGNKDAEPVLENGDAEIALSIPMDARLGARYRHLAPDGHEVFDLELNFVYEAWSAIKAFDVKLTGKAGVKTPNAQDPSSPFYPVPITDLTNISLDKRWRDTYSVRLGGTWNAVPNWFSWSLGGLFESGAIPPQYTNLDFLSWDRFGVGTGFRFTHWGVDLSIAYMFIHQLTREVAEEDGKVFQQRPFATCPKYCDGLTGVPANAGKFESQVHQLQISLQLHFDEWVKKKPVDAAPVK